MDQISLIEFFHREMRELAIDHAQMMAVADFIPESGVTSEDVEAGKSEFAQAFRGVRDAYFQRADDFSNRFDAAKIGDWNDHMDISGARNIIDDDLAMRP